MKHLNVLTIALIMALTCSVVNAVPIELNPERALTFEWQSIVHINSPVDLYVANHYDLNRYKDWKIMIGVPVGDTPVTQITVDYDNTDDHSAPFVIKTVDLASAGTADFAGETYNMYYASTWESQWEQFGTQAANGSDQFPYVGNPAWVSFHFDVNVDPLVYIKDVCAPEPASMALLALGGLLLRRKTK